MKDRYLITGGAGFIGTNLADHYLAHNKHVTIFDNFSRAGTGENLRCLQERYGDRLIVVCGDIRWAHKELSELVEDAEVVFHLAAQVAVTTSVTNSRADFEVNALGTFNLLEAVRASAAKPIVVYSSTNKVYGKMMDLEISERNSRYTYACLPDGVPETRSLDFYSPYGCSKGTGDQYVLDYARSYGLNTIVFRQSCIYGPHQFGMEDQGWVAWFAIRALQNLPVTIYGDGKQVRDVLYIDDLIAVYDLAIAGIAKTSGQAYNIGGGPQNTLSLRDLIRLLEHEFGLRLEYSFADWRPGDQLVFISNIHKAKADFGWGPRVDVRAGLAKLVDWLKRNDQLFLQPVSR
jgi:CDP-paratose 2-epimerase